jgi:hypothetical protein
MAALQTHSRSNSSVTKELVLKVITQMTEITYSSYFHVEEQITITKESDAKCKFVCFTGIVFNKGTSMKSIILSRTFEDLQLDYKVIIFPFSSGATT